MSTRLLSMFLQLAQFSLRVPEDSQCSCGISCTSVLGKTFVLMRLMYQVASTNTPIPAAPSGVVNPAATDVKSNSIGPATLMPLMTRSISWRSNHRMKTLTSKCIFGITLVERRFVLPQKKVLHWSELSR
ncbi:hypothetical protein K435DRAFT_259156 [Dendrothele bispora CBS 962.96]|uniref:Secreted protein n=1 Tax=Dendrothele bispora (strain CBS 962.96) TaxID=1314807 RepID=A0A4S8MWE4_DENBC|nr:hypothetical protein K435DRAFT_259156 [Dendrothele bispora CBS 962.96]